MVSRFIDESGQVIAISPTTPQDNPSALDPEHVHAANMEVIDQMAIEEALPLDISSAAAKEGGEEEPVTSGAPLTQISTPYLRDWTPDTCLTNVHGECPTDTPILEWFNGLKTVSPLNSYVSELCRCYFLLTMNPVHRMT